MTMLWNGNKKRRVMQALSLDSIPMEHCLLPASCPVVMAIASTASELLVYKYHQRQAESVRLSLHVASIHPKCQFSWNQTGREIAHHGETNECREGEQPRRFGRAWLRERAKNNEKKVSTRQSLQYVAHGKFGLSPCSHRAIKESILRHL